MSTGGCFGDIHYILCLSVYISALFTAISTMMSLTCTDNFSGNSQLFDVM